MRIRTIVAVTALAVGLAACGGQNGGGGGGDAAGGGGGSGSGSQLDLVTAGTLTVCTDSPYPPMEFERNGKFVGFDMDLVRAIADQMGLDTKIINSGFEPITSGAVFAAETCDMAASSITITEKRKKNIDYSDPYFKADQSLLVKKDSGISSLEDLKGKTIGVQTGTTGAIYAREHKPKGATIKAFDKVSGLFLALEAGTIDAILQDLVANQGRALDDKTVEVVASFPTDERYGFAFPEKGSQQLIEAVNKALDKIRENGTYAKIYKKWFGEAPSN